MRDWFHSYRNPPRRTLQMYVDILNQGPVRQQERYLYYLQFVNCNVAVKTLVYNKSCFLQNFQFVLMMNYTVTFLETNPTEFN